jgi:hypothetical protein
MTGILAFLLAMVSRIQNVSVETPQGPDSKEAEIVRHRWTM